MTTESLNADPIADIEERLSEKYVASAGRAQVHEVVQRAYESFDAATIRAYIPLLVSHMADDELMQTMVGARPAA